MDSKIKYNDGEEEIYCVYCKELIQYGQKYVEVQGEGCDYTKIYHLDCCPIEEEDE